jgi:hypothetical protein
VIENHLTFKDHLHDLGIEEVIEAEDSLDKYKKGLNEILIRAVRAHDSGGKIKLLIYVYYAGHGVMYAGHTMT